MITTTFNLNPLIIQSFRKDLLSCVISFLEIIRKRKEKILIKALKKIRPQDIMKKREFDSLIKEFEELHGRKTIEKDKYDKERKKRYEEMPSSGSTARFKRFEGI